MESFLDLADENLDEAKEPKAAEGGEYTLKLVDWKSDDEGGVVLTDRNDLPYMMPVLEIVDCEEAEYAKNINHFLRLLHKDMTAKERNGAKWALKEFCECFGIDYTQRIDPEEQLGSTGDALLFVAEDEGYGEQNKIRKFLLPR